MTEIGVASASYPGSTRKRSTPNASPQPPVFENYDRYWACKLSLPSLSGRSQHFSWSQHINCFDVGHSISTAKAFSGFSKACKRSLETHHLTTVLVHTKNTPRPASSPSASFPCCIPPSLLLPRQIKLWYATFLAATEIDEAMVVYISLFT